MGLFAPAWQTDNLKKADKAIQAVRKIAQPDKLFEIAINAPQDKVAVAAVEAIHDPMMLFRLATQAKSERVQRAAVGILEDQPLLARIALEGGNKWTADDAARKVHDPELAFKLAMSSRECAAHGVYWISDPEVLKKIVLGAPTEEARSAAASALNDADALIEILERDSDPKVRRNALWQLDRCREKAPLTPEQRERVVQLMIREPDDGRDRLFSLSSSDDPEDLQRIYREAARLDVRMSAFGCLADRAEDEALPRFYREAKALVHSLPYEKSEPCRNVLDRIERRVLKRGGDNPVLLTAFISDAGLGCSMVSPCVRALFDGKLDNRDGIDAMRDEAVKAFLSNIPKYDADEKHCVMQLAPHLPPAAQEKYGFKVWHDEREDEDQYGRNTVTVTHVEWQGKHYSYP